MTFQEVKKILTTKQIKFWYFLRTLSFLIKLPPTKKGCLVISMINFFNYFTSWESFPRREETSWIECSIIYLDSCDSDKIDYFNLEEYVLKLRY